MNKMEGEGSLPALLRKRTWHCHEELERLPFVAALSNGELPLESYLGQLRGLALFFATLGQLLARWEGDTPRTLAGFVNRRFEQICQDLAFFAPRGVADLVPALRVALDAAGRLRGDGSREQLAAWLYVLEGTMKGNQVHLADVKRSLQLQGEEGCRFYRGYGGDTDEHWLEFSRLFDTLAAELDPDRVADAVARLYAELGRFHGHLYPVAEGARGVSALSLNPEAGDHPVPADPEMRGAALRAAQRCWDEFSYYQKRYGARGRRFADSDVAWLATLSTLPEAAVVEQVLWLGRLLAVRGMPSYLLERQLALLDQELAELEAPPRRDGLQGALRRLAADRVASLQPGWDELVERVTAAVPGQAGEFPDLPVILAAAWADRCSGVPECLASLLDWLESSSLLTGVELQGVREALKQP